MRSHSRQNASDRHHIYAWCDNLESYSDFSNRLPRGRTYVRNGSVIDLEIELGKITSLVSVSHPYRITIRVRPLAAARWKAISQQCGARIGSVVELLHARPEIFTGESFVPFPASRCASRNPLARLRATGIYGL